MRLVKTWMSICKWEQNSNKIHWGLEVDQIAHQRAWTEPIMHFKVYLQIKTKLNLKSNKSDSKHLQYMRDLC